MWTVVEGAYIRSEGGVKTVKTGRKALKSSLRVETAKITKKDPVWMFLP